MHYIGIDVHRKKCVTTIKGKAKRVLKRTVFDNDIDGINGFIAMLRKDGYLPATAACESTGNYWIVLHDTLEAAGIDTLLAHPDRLQERQGRLGEAGRAVQAGHDPGVVCGKCRPA